MSINPKFVNMQEYKICSNSDEHINLGIVENFNAHKSDTIPKNINFYPTKGVEFNNLLNEISQYVNCDADNILITAGSGKGLDLILHAFTITGTKILIPIPNYPGFIHSSEISNGEIIFIKDFYGNDEDFMRLNEQISNANIIYFSTPNLPIGYIVKKSHIIESIKKYPNKLFIFDEAYYEYSGEESHSNLINTYKNVIVTRTFSKTFALAGARIGYIISHKDNINTLRIGYNDKDVIDSSVKYALNTLQNKKYYLNNVTNDKLISQYLDKNLDKFINDDSQIYDYSIPMTPWFLIYAKDTKLVCKIMKERGYIVRDKSQDIPNCIRISLCTIDHIDNVLDIIIDINKPNTDHTEKKHIKTLFIDLDGTLRKNRTKKIPEKIQNTLNKLKDTYEIKIVTDSFENTEDISQYLKENNLDFNIISPINKQMNPNNRDWFIYKKCVYIISFPHISYELISAVKLFKKIKVIEMDEFINSAELGIEPNVKLPHIGKFYMLISSLVDTKLEFAVIGKQTLYVDTKNGIVIGDSLNDEVFARNNKLPFYKVKSTNDTYDILKNLLNE